MGRVVTLRFINHRAHHLGRDSFHSKTLVMDWPTKLDVLIEYSDEDQREKHSTLLKHVSHYGWAYGPMALYQTDDGEKFWLDAEYYRECKETSKIVRIPIEVIKKNEAIQQKLAEGQYQLMQDQKKKSTGLVIPPGIDV